MTRYFSAILLVVFLLGFIPTIAEAQVGRGKFGFGLSFVGNAMQSDWKSTDVGFGGSADLSYALGSGWGLVSKVGVNSFTGKNTASQNVLSTLLYGNLGLSIDILPSQPLNPFLFGTVGLGFYTPRIDNGVALTSGAAQMWDMSVSGGLGFDFFISESWSFMITAETGMLLNDQLDGYKVGGTNDIFGQVSVGIRYYLFDRSAVEEIVEKVRR